MLRFMERHWMVETERVWSFQIESKIKLLNGTIKRHGLATSANSMEERSINTTMIWCNITINLIDLLDQQPKRSLRQLLMELNLRSRSSLFGTQSERFPKEKYSLYNPCLTERILHEVEQKQSAFQESHRNSIRITHGNLQILIFMSLRSWVKRRKLPMLVKLMDKF